MVVQTLAPFSNFPDLGCYTNGSKIEVQGPIDLHPVEPDARVSKTLTSRHARPEHLRYQKVLVDVECGRLHLQSILLLVLDQQVFEGPEALLVDLRAVDSDGFEIIVHEDDKIEDGHVLLGLDQSVRPSTQPKPMGIILSHQLIE